jgi:DNA replication protein DnaC
MTTFEPVKEFISRLGINPTDDFIIDRFFEFETAYNNELTCQECKGFTECPYQTPGIKTILEIAITETMGFENVSIISTAAECERKRQYIRQREVEKLLESSRMPELLREKTFENFEISDGTKEAFEIAQKYCREGGRGIVFAGSCGIGKSHLAAAIMNVEIEKFRDVVFCTVPELMDDIKRTIRNQEESSELMELVKNADLLILDDLGAEKSTEFVAERLFVIVNARLMRKKDTIITTNYTKPSDLIDKLGGGVTGQRIVSRIRELCQWVVVTGKDYRLG